MAEKHIFIKREETGKPVELQPKEAYELFNAWIDNLSPEDRANYDTAKERHEANKEQGGDDEWKQIFNTWLSSARIEHRVEFI